MKKADLKLWVAILVLIGLVVYLIFVSKQTDQYRQKQINDLKQALQSLPVPKDGQNGYTPIKGVDYVDGLPGKSIKGDKGDTGAKGDQGAPGKDGNSCSVTQLESGATVACTDGTQATISNGQSGEAGREQELRCNNGQLQTRFTGDFFWKQTNISCESRDE